MTHFRIRYITRGDHTHFDVYAGSDRQTTHGKAGSLCLRNNEFADFRALYQGAAVEFIDYDTEHSKAD